VVGTAVGGVPEVLAEGGLLVRPRNPEDLAQACLTLLRDPQRCEELGVRARAYAEANFSLERSIDAYANLYRRLKGLLVCSKQVVPAWARQGARALADSFAAD
jgi:glycosyltransferase involved in cell wall biosynthesis